MGDGAPMLGARPKTALTNRLAPAFGLGAGGGHPWRKFGRVFALAAVISAGGVPAVANAEIEADKFGAAPTLELNPKSAQQVLYEIGPINSAEYSLESSEEPDLCESSELNVYGTNSGWVPIQSTVKGTVSVRLAVPRSAEELEKGSPYLSDLFLRSGFGIAGTCDFELYDKANETFVPPEVSNVEVAAEQVVYIQWMGTNCVEEIAKPSGACASTPLHVAKRGGPTTILVTLTPTDTDKDGIPDTRDHCPNQFGTEPNGCPPTPPPPPRPPPPPPADSDHDGIPDSQDMCLHEFADSSISEAGDGRAGCPEPLKHHLNVEFGKTRKGATLRAYSLVAPVGSNVTLSCRGRACPRSLPQLTTTTSTTGLVSLFRHGRLRRGKALWIPVGTTITVTVTHSGALGWRISFSPRKHGHPREPETCVSLSGATIKCPG
jgi:hypothetical protein